MGGRVHGVGFRPFVWRLARALAVTGSVRNDGSGVIVEAWGPNPVLDDFLGRLKSEAPPLARIDAEAWTEIEGPIPEGFSILPSDQGPILAEVAPDVATCSECLADVLNPRDRRYRYAFTNCTNCGPRLSIIRGIPYDRPLTSMAGFAMCAACQADYDDPDNRRFHAQPIACPTCGPKLWLENRQGLVPCDDPITEVARRLKAGEIAAIKGIGGFQLACDATSPEAVAELRRRKLRGAKPLALMARDLAVIRRYCAVSDQEVDALCSPAAPIVILEARGDTLEGVAPGLVRLGVMLPNTPLHHLLLAGMDRPIVLTSGNVSSAPQATGNDAARTKLAAVADGWLMHDREIVTRLDDSVVRIDPAGPSILRRARGLAPDSIALATAFARAPTVLAMGGDLKAAFCLLRDGHATPSPHVGDLDDADVFADYRRQVSRFLRLYGLAPAVVAIDLHSDYLSARWGRVVASETGARLVSVQHHHAHFAACLAENGVPPGDDRCVGIILDGAGAGLDGTIWGGEILLGGYRDVVRRSHFPAVPLPGGDRAAREPWRNTVAHLAAAFGPEWRKQLHSTELAARFADAPVRLIEDMIAKRVNSPLSSSAGRLFDAAAAAVGFRGSVLYEGQAAMELEALADPYMADAGPYPFEISRFDGRYVPLWAAMWRALLSDLRSSAEPGLIAARFHRTIVASVAEMALRIAEEASARRVALSGGVMQNRHVREGLAKTLRRHGLEVLLHKAVPSNDGGLSLGQAAVAVSGNLGGR
ncbi:MAG: carbamoyltransferase HypF [Rhodobacteraceae bacterium]|nr:carbamoyltransferase HypF [Paracoccaceae bacterium]